MIQKAFLDLQFNGRVDTFRLQKEVGDWCNRELLPVLDEVLQPFHDVSEHLQIDCLEIAVDVDGNEDWKTQMTRLVTQQIKEQLAALEQAETVTGVTRKSGERHFADLLVFYLEQGHLPWWSRVKSRGELEEQWRLWLRGEAVETGGLRTALQKKAARLRVMHHLPPGMFDAFVKKLNPAMGALLPSLWSDLEQLTAGYTVEASSQARKALQDRLLENIDLNALTDISQLTKYLSVENASSTAPGPDDIALSERSSVRSKEPQASDEAIFINNAGLVILANFLPLFFGRLGVSEGGQLKKPATALCLLHYLLMGEEGAAEFELVLPKILCGLEVEEVVDTNVRLSEDQKEEAYNLLLSVIEHWSILKNTSVDGLRESFLQREGKLSFHGGEWLLQVEQKSYDMLLQQIPWNIGMVRLSWMRHVLKTEWV